MATGVQEQILTEIKSLNALLAQISTRPIAGQEVHVVAGLSEISEKLGLIMAGEFRATDHPEIAPGDGFTGVRLTEAGLKAYNNDLQTVGIENDGDAMFGSDVSAASTTGWQIFSVAQTYNGESMGAGDVLFGDNSSNAANILWDASEGALIFRLGTISILQMGAAGFQYVGDPGTAGVAYFCGGYSSKWQGGILKINFATDAVLNFFASLAHPMEPGGSASAAAAGYLLGGYIEGTALIADTVKTSATAQKLTFASGVISLISSADLDTARGDVGTVHNSSAGYTAGGYNAATTSWLTSIEKLVYSTETNAAIGSVLPVATRKQGSIFSSAAGYFVGGEDAAEADVATNHKITFATDVVSTSTVLPAARLGPIGVSGSLLGILAGGSFWNGSVTTWYAACTKLTYATEVMAAISAVLSSERRRGRGASNQTVGYVSSGFIAGGVSSAITDKVTFATETISIIPAHPYTSPANAGSLVYL